MTLEEDMILESAYPLSAVQSGMLFSRLHAPSSGVDIEQMVASVSEELDVEALESAWAEVVERHAVLRSRVRLLGLDAPLQEVVQGVRLPLVCEDWSAVDGATRVSRLSAFLREDRIRGVDLDEAPTMRLRLFRFGPRDHRLVWTFAHIFLDGGCFAKVLEEVFAAYEAIRSGSQPTLRSARPFGDHVAWLQVHLRDTSAASAAFWAEMLAGFEAPNRLPRTPELAPESPPDRLHPVGEARLSREETSALRDFALSLDVTLSTLVEAAWGLSVGDFSADADVVFGVVRACRRGGLPEAPGMIGLFINTLPLRLPPRGDRTVSEWLTEVRRRDLAMRPFEHTPLADVRAACGFRADQPLFESLLVFNEARRGTWTARQGGASVAREVLWIEQTGFPLTLFVHAEPELELALCRDPARVSAETAKAMMARFREALLAMVKQPAVRVAALRRVPPAEMKALDASNATALPFASGRCAHELIADEARRRPGATALVFREREVSYLELDARAEQVARSLQEMGVGPETLVGVFTERSIEMVVSLLAIWKAGGAYVPLDPSYPPARIAAMLEDSRAPVVIVQRGLEDQIPVVAARRLSVDASCHWGATRAANVTSAVSPANLAYVMFTSGSTGRPKGVLVEHRNVVAFFAGMDERLGTRPGVWLALTSVSFDISVLELLWTLSRGYEVVLQEERTSAALTARAVASAAPRPRMDFSLFYFASESADTAQGKYRLLLEGAKFADRSGFAAIWTPERHFHAFGGLFPNPSLTSAALAVLTERIQIRGGSVVLPLHDPVRVAEEWSVVDNLSGGRVGLSVASGWHADDFVLAPGNYPARRELMWSQLALVRRLWAGEAVRRPNGEGEEVEVRIHPSPIQKQVPIWVTAAGSAETFRSAGELGANVLTNMLGQTREELEEKIATYRAARRAAGHEGPGHVSLMLHTFVAEDAARVRETVRAPFTAYLRSSTDLIRRAKWYFPAFRGSQDARTGADLDGAAPADVDALLAHAFDRYFETHGLFGSPESCVALVSALQASGVDEIACLVDFGVDTDEVLDSLVHLDRLRRACAPETPRAEDSIAARIRLRQVTHMQCTPSLARALLEEPETREALGALEQLLLGGEALPESLAEELHGLLREGALLNMYGPTETTVWSSSAVLRRGEPITVGHPIANTSMFVLDAERRPTPVGVVGELYIGGAGVTRGYLNRPDLTNERFVDAPFGGEGRLYRTGDRARWRPDGDVEILGRVDQQIKVRGHRVELAEVETVLGQHHAVHQVAVVARRNGRGDEELVAHVVPESEPGEAMSRGAHWGSVWERAYQALGVAGPRPSGEKAHPGFELAGWNSSYGGHALPENEMREWVSDTAARILELRPQNVLEIGCGTGLLLHRVAPHVRRYVGVEPSAGALAAIEAELQEHPIPQVSLIRARADELTGLPVELYDTIVINSVIQYFPDVHYLLRVLEWALDRLGYGGALFVGDVRNLDLLEAYHTSVELHHARPATTREELRERVLRRASCEEELVVSPELFEALGREHQEVADVAVTLKRGHAENELTKFRYDVLIRRRSVGSAGLLPRPTAERVLPGSSLRGAEDIRRELRASPAGLRVLGLPNARLARELRTTALLASARGGRTVGELRALLDSEARLRDPGEAAFAPEELRTLDPAYEATLTWTQGSPGHFDALWLPRGGGGLAAGHARVARLGRLVPRLPWESYVHHPRPLGLGESLLPELRRHLRAILPEAMVPSSFVLCGALPMTPAGKIDRAGLSRALPASGVREMRPPKHPPVGDTERAIAAIWQELLGVSEVGRTDNFGDMGASSLVIMSANARIRAALNKEISLVEMFRFPTIAQLAAHLADDAPIALFSLDPAEVDAAQRGRQRRDAIARRPHAPLGLSKDGSK